MDFLPTIPVAKVTPSAGGARLRREGVVVGQQPEPSTSSGSFAKWFASSWVCDVVGNKAKDASACKLHGRRIPALRMHTTVMVARGLDARPEQESEDEVRSGQRSLPGGIVVGMPLLMPLKALMEGPRQAELRAKASAYALVALSAFGGGVPAAHGAATMACLPLPVCGLVDFCAQGLGLDELSLIPEVSPGGLEKGLMAAALFQGSIGLTRICLGDYFNGLYQVLLATVGFNARHPGPAAGYLQTYVLITCFNISMGSVDLLQTVLLPGIPLFHVAFPLKVNIMHLVQLLGPIASSMGVYFGWESVKAQKAEAYKAMAYQQQALQQQAMQQLRWPPPPLPQAGPGMVQLTNAQGETLGYVPMPPGGRAAIEESAEEVEQRAGQ